MSCERIANLQFSQHNLQDYADCPRRFHLRHLDGVRWPAVQAEPIGEAERRARLGQRFHQMAHQHALGIPADRLAAGLDDPELEGWWRNFLSTPPPNLPNGMHRAEVTLSIALLGHRLLARYDFLAVDPGERMVIVDWKIKRPQQLDRLQTKMQSVVYPYVLVEGGTTLNDGLPVSPEQVSMVYWFADAPNSPLALEYDTGCHNANGQQLAAIVREIETRQEEIWPLTDDTRACKFCTYRSLCERGSAAGGLDELDEDLELEDLNINLAQIAEIAYQ